MKMKVSSWVEEPRDSLRREREVARRVYTVKQGHDRGSGGCVRDQGGRPAVNERHLRKGPPPHLLYLEPIGPEGKQFRMRGDHPHPPKPPSL